ncbi:MAG: T9SS type A sorting domain-containing protein [Bacteroidales bacterium]|nr:T9SS type A sorting domain-containing protein [Bacteroidales bacterium]
MKAKFFFSILTFGLIVSAFSQKPTIELSFTAINNGQYVILDSILIENLTLGGDTTLYAPDSVLALEYNTGFNDTELSDNTFSVSQNYPNPFTDKTIIKLFLPEKEHIEISIIDILGKEVAHYENTLISGKYSFTFYPGIEKNYLFIVSGSYSTQTIKMLKVNSNPTFARQCRIVYSKYEDNVIGYKSQKAISDFVFNSGNQLRYTGYATTIDEVIGSDVIEDTPENIHTYPFEITEGIPCNGIPTITLEDEVYNTVLIGEQCWMKENLNVGIRIDGSVHVSNDGVLEKYCYNDNISNCELYGALYHWKEMMLYSTTQGIQGICPEGWHLPSDDEWTTLINYLGGEEIAGGKLKEKGTIHWDSPNTGATNESGFFALPGGGRYNHGGFQTLGVYGDFWSSTENGFSDAWYRSLKSTNSEVSRGLNNKANCHSVRCVRD